MRDLRILNLEDNRITHLGGVENLQSLTELNLKRNEIQTSTTLSDLDHLRRLSISQNNISSFDTLSEICKAPHLTGKCFPLIPLPPLFL
ncbi:hypothetical protein HDV00_009091 [Rhizophlyctis rosea]|nr:hypothetical protein HDV00_009091 [Rhizophlyctis rosea]